MGRPRKSTTIHPANPEAAKRAAAEAVERLHPGSVARRIAEADKAAQEAVASGQKPPRSKYLTTKLNADPIRAIIFDQLAPDAVLAKLNVDGHVTMVRANEANAPIQYMRFRTEAHKRIDAVQYAAARRFAQDSMLGAGVGSNTNAIITHLQTGPKDDIEYRAEIKAAEARGTDYGLMRSAAECKSGKDPADAMLASAFRLRRITEKLEQWERSVLDDLIVKETTVGMIATRWGITSEAASVLLRIALWKLVRVYEETDKEFQAWLSIHRQETGEARE